MTPRTRRLTPFAALLAVGLLAACGGEQEGDSGGESSPEPSTVTVTSTAEPETADEPQQQELTKKQITAALPEEADAPKGFEEDSQIDATNKRSTRETDPAECVAIYLDSEEARDWREKHHTASDAKRYTQPGDAAGRASVSTFISTYDRPVPKKFFDEAGQTLGDCATFSEKSSSEGNWIDKRSSNISAPVLGDQSYAHRVGLTDLDLTVDQLWVRSGHNIINIRVLTGNADYSDETMSTIAEGVLEDLEG